MKIHRTKFYCALLLLAAGIVRAQKPGTDVSQTVAERTGKQIRAFSGEDDGAARNLVRKLLLRPLTADRAAQIALFNNRSMQAALEEVGISQADLREAGMLKNPEFAGSARFPGNPTLAADLEGALTQNFLDLLMLPLRKRVAASLLEQTKLRVADEALELVAGTKTAFYELQAQMQLAGRMRLILETNEAATELAQKQHEAGNINDLVLANQQAACSQSRLDVAMAEADIREKREKLNRLLGVWGGDTDWKADDELPPVPGTDFSTKGLESLAVSRRLDLAAAHAQLVSVVQALGLTKNYRFVGALDIGIDSERGTDNTTVTGPTLRIELPVFNQGQARVAKAEAQLRQAEARFEALAVGIRSEVREKRDRLVAMRDAAKLYRDELLPERIRIVHLTQLHYNAMLVGLFDLLLAKQSELNAERGSIEAARDYWIARAELERAVGGSLGTEKISPAKNKNKNQTSN